MFLDCRLLLYGLVIGPILFSFYGQTLMIALEFKMVGFTFFFFFSNLDWSYLHVFSMCIRSKTPAVPLNNYNKPRGKCKSIYFYLGKEIIVNLQSFKKKKDLVVILLVVLYQNSI